MKLRRLAGAAAFFMLGGMTAASLAVDRKPTQAAAAPRPSIPSDRIPVQAAAVRQALADGEIGTRWMPLLSRTLTRKITAQNPLTSL